ncbi:MAG: oxygenase MpaB family protein [Candidatus Nanopelagicales bacterium]|nr:oxygenase MpaB family protein [Candidatus Nanopelagicales bacterium]
MVDGLRDRVASGFRRMVSGDPSGAPAWVRDMATGSDEGYFGPESAAWAVHGSLPTLVGGIRALLMQALHPGALAGVQQHSRYQDDAMGRLAGTTQWLTVVTFGDKAAADRECARVRGMHRRVVGTYASETGQRSYAASDPDLLRWVHIAFTDSFLATHRVWGGGIPGGEDAYVREWATAGELVGVDNPPRSVAELRNQISDYGPQLRGDVAARETARFIRNVPVPLAGRPAYAVLFAGAVSTLPQEHRRMLGVPDLPLAVTRPAVAGILATLAKILGPASPSMQAAHARVDTLAADVQAP